MIYLGNRNKSKVVYFGIILFLYIIIGVVPIQSAILRTENPTSKSYTYVVALVGGGNNPQPGEISLAHNGVLFLDELSELSRSVLEVLRQPLEDRKITISRAKYNVEYPCSFMLIASMNPCPCGYYGDPTHNCACTPGQIQRYMNKISGPLLYRIDIHCEIQTVPFAQLSQMEPGEPSEKIRERVIAARKIQEERFKNHKGIHCNTQMTEKMLHEYAEPDAAWLQELRQALRPIPVRWQDGFYHITMAFIDDTPVGVDLCPIFEKHLGNYPAPVITFDRLDFFMTNSGGQVIYLTASAIPQSFLELTEAIRRDLKAVGCVILSDFRLHVTLGRVRERDVRLKELIETVHVPPFSLKLTDVDYRVYRGKTLFVSKLK